MISIVCEDQRITTRQLALRLSVSKGSVTSFEISDIRRRVRCGFLGESQWNTKSKKSNFSELLARFAAEEETLFRIFTPGETCVHHFEPETKKHSIIWHHPQSLTKKKIRKVSVSRNGHSLPGP
jgi:hypothetical protein